jgi:hypothetical protein
MSKSDPTPPMSEETKQFIRALNRLVAIYETHPELPVPNISALYVFLKTREQVSSVARSLAKWKLSKSVSREYFDLSLELSAKHKLTYTVPRDKVCERVQVGVKTVEVPAQPAVEAHVEEIPQYEWKCPDALLAPGVGA